MIEHTIIPVKNTAYITVKQSPDVDTFMQAARIFMQDPEYSPALNRICDFSQSDLSHVTAHDFMEFAKFAVEEIELAPVDPIESAQAIIDGYRLGPDLAFGGSRACYSPLADRVELPEMSKFLSAELFYSVAFHELGHSTGHADRLNRPELVGGATFGDHRYSQEELCAEFTAAMLCQRSGITTDETHENSVAYLRGWLKALKDCPEMLVKAGWAAQKAADHICGTELAPAASAA